MEILTHSATETQALGCKLAVSLVVGDIVCLYGDLGSGKTTFVHGLAAGLGCLMVTSSPTFTIIHTYPVSKAPLKRLHHVDLYRITKARDISKIGLEELFADPEAAAVIEWVDKLDHLPAKRIEVHFAYGEGDMRKIRITRYE